ncbi:MAG TPA: hypothetical protein VFE78_15315 [Gemmataceae bacterium]|jgi:hypothetical protein|nr:hypothetical protein [Gemmataceae bacterium]
MTQIVVDEILRGKLQNLTQPVELCDSSGRVLGRVFPLLDPSEYDLEPKISHEELQRRKQSKEKTYTTAEVLAYLERL